MAFPIRHLDNIAPLGDPSSFGWQDGRSKVWGMVKRRIGKEDSETRQALLDAAERLMREEGYAQVTSRKLARYADLKPQLVHYYFRTMDELFEALFVSATDKYLASLEEAARSPYPLARLFDISSDSSHAQLNVEFLALANHRKAMHVLIADFGQRLNEMKAQIVRQALEAEGIDTPGMTPEDLSTLMETLARGLAFAGGFNHARVSKVRLVLLGWLENFGETYKKLAELDGGIASIDDTVDRDS